MSRAAYNEFLSLQNELADLPHINLDDKDTWSFIWGSNFYSSSNFYQLQFRELHPEKAIIWI
jgi:hypothetical protein